MTALRWTRRLLDALLAAAVLAVVTTAALQLLAPVAGGRAMVIGGGSMEPAIGRGAFVLALPAGAEGYTVGDVVTVHQGGGTPYTHRITRLADLAGVPYVETKGDANAAPDPAIVPTAAIIGRVAVSVPLLGYLVMLLATAAGLAGFLAACATMLILVWVIEELEDQRCPACAAAASELEAGSASAAASAPSVDLPLTGFVAAGAFAGLPAFAVAAPPSRVRVTGRPRDAATPVFLERDRRDPRRHGTATFPDAPPAPAPTDAAVATGAAAETDAAVVAVEAGAAANAYPADVAA